MLRPRASNRAPHLSPTPRRPPLRGGGMHNIPRPSPPHPARRASQAPLAGPRTGRCTGTAAGPLSARPACRQRARRVAPAASPPRRPACTMPSHPTPHTRLAPCCRSRKLALPCSFDAPCFAKLQTTRPRATTSAAVSLNNVLYSLPQLRYRCPRHDFAPLHCSNPKSKKNKETNSACLRCRLRPPAFSGK